MKKILTIISLVTATTLVQAQGYIAYYGGVANIQTNGATAGKTAAFSSGLTYDYELLYETTTLVGTSSSPTNSAWSPVLAYGNTALALGTNGAGPGSVYGPGSSGGVGTALTALTAYSVELVGWSSTIGSFANALTDISNGMTGSQAGFIGWTPVGSITPIATIGGGDPTLFPATWANGTLVLNPVTVPEPTSLALAALGGASLLAFRRKNK